MRVVKNIELSGNLAQLPRRNCDDLDLLVVGELNCREGTGLPIIPYSITVKHFQILCPNVEIGRHVEVKYFSNVGIVLKNQVNVDPKPPPISNRLFATLYLAARAI